MHILVGHRTGFALLEMKHIAKFDLKADSVTAENAQGISSHFGL